MISIATLAANRDARANKELVRPVVAVTLGFGPLSGVQRNGVGWKLRSPKVT